MFTIGTVARDGLENNTNKPRFHEMPQTNEFPAGQATKPTKRQRFGERTEKASKHLTGEVTEAAEERHVRDPEGLGQGRGSLLLMGDGVLHILSGGKI